jgi:predicted RNA-binding Zn-ribbon protein involved in translation (DUF1610 family)
MRSAWNCWYNEKTGEEPRMEFLLDGYCGLYCGACPILLATRNRTGEQACHGCKTDRNPEWCATCELKACARKRGVEFCYLCAEYPCGKLERFTNSAEYPYHSEVYDYMKTIQTEGAAAWLEHMKTRWSCPACGKDASWWDQTCTQCGERLKGYSKPPSKTG